MSLDEKQRQRVHGDVISQEARQDEVAPAFFVVDDEKILKKVLNDPDLKNAAALYSRILGLTKIDTKTMNLFKTKVDLAFGTLEACMDEDEYNAGKWLKLDSNAEFLKMRIHDSHKGFKMRLLSRLRKEIVISPEQKPGRWPWSKEE